ncbi:hypothetical protein BsWGS_01257 [Bradybaena similaris]
MSDVTFDAEPEEYEDDNSRRPSTSSPHFAEASGGVNTSSSQPENQEVDENFVRLNLKHVELSDDSNNDDCDHDQCKDDFYHDQFTQHDQWFPPELKKKLHIAIINDENDADKAHELKYFIEENVHLKLGGKHFRPKVELLDHVNPGKHNDELDYVLDEADYLFVLVTNNFRESNLRKYESIASMRAILTEDKRCCLVCVHTDQPGSNTGIAKLDNAKQLYYWKKELFIKQIKRYFEDISDRLLTEKLQLTQLRQKCFYAKLPFLWKQEQFTSDKENNTGTGKKTAPANYMDRDSGTRKEGERKPEATSDRVYCGPPTHVARGGESTRTRQRDVQGGSQDNVQHRRSHIEEGNAGNDGRKPTNAEAHYRNEDKK